MSTILSVESVRVVTYYTASEHIVSGVFQKGEHSAIWVSDNQPRVQKSHCGESLDDTLRANWRLFGASPPPLSSLLSREDRLAKTRFHAPPVDSRSLATRRILKLFLKFLELSCGEISVGGSIASCNRLCVFSESHRASWECRLDPLFVAGVYLVCVV